MESTIKITYLITRIREWDNEKEIQTAECNRLRNRRFFLHF